MGMAELVAIELVDYLEGESYFGIGDAEVIAEMAPIAQGAVSDRINELIDEPHKTGWSESMIHMPIQEAFYALQSVRHVGRGPIRNTPPQAPTPAKSGGKRKKKRKRKRRGRRRGQAVQHQEKLFHPDEDPNDPDNYEEESDPGGPFYESDGLSARDQAWLAQQSKRDSQREGYFDEEQPF
jgi:hypothetical protein